MDEKSKVGRPPEEWRTLDIDPTVQVSSRGRIKRRGKISKAKCVDKDGYRKITIKHKTYSIHRLVAELFIPNPNNYPVVDHINNIHDDNRVCNLRWTTVQLNSQYSAQMGLQARLQNNKSVVLAIDKDNKGYLFNTVADCARELNLDPLKISMVLVGKAKTVKKYRFVRVDELADFRKIINNTCIN